MLSSAVRGYLLSQTMAVDHLLNQRISLLLTMVASYSSGPPPEPEVIFCRRLWLLAIIVDHLLKQRLSSVADYGF